MSPIIWRKAWLQLVCNSCGHKHPVSVVLTQEAIQAIVEQGFDIAEVLGEGAVIATGCPTCLRWEPTGARREGGSGA